jgi:hypothetical protein
MTRLAALLAATAAALLAAAPAPAQILGGGDLVVVDAGTGAQRVLARGSDALWASPPCFTAQGGVVAGGTFRDLGRSRYVEYAPDGSRREVGPVGPANTIVFSPGCARVAEGRLKMPGRPRRNGLVVRTPASPSPLAQLFSYWPVEGEWMAWSNDGRRIADVDDTRRREAIRITDAASGATIARRSITQSDAYVWDGAFSPDGDQVLFHQNRWSRRRGIAAQEVSVFDIPSGTFRTLSRRRLRPGDELGFPAWSPRGDRIALTIGDRLHLLDVEGRDLGVVAPGAIVGGAPVWSPDGTRIAFAALRRLPRPRNPRRFPVRRFANDLVVAPAEPGAWRRTVLRDVSSRPAWSADGTSLAAITGP